MPLEQIRFILVSSFGGVFCCWALKKINFGLCSHGKHKRVSTTCDCVHNCTGFSVSDVKYVRVCLR